MEIIIVIISFVVAVIGLIIGNWLALIPTAFLSGVLVFIPKKYSGLSTLYLSRINMGLIVGVVFAILDWWFGLYNPILTTTFLFWAIFLSEPYSEVQSYDIFKNNLSKYFFNKIGLKTSRIVAYFVAKLGLYYIFLLYF